MYSRIKLAKNEFINEDNEFRKMSEKTDRNKIK